MIIGAAQVAAPLCLGHFFLAFAKLVAKRKFLAVFPSQLFQFRNEFVRRNHLTWLHGRQPPPQCSWTKKSPENSLHIWQQGRRVNLRCSFRRLSKTIQGTTDSRRAPGLFQG